MKKSFTLCRIITSNIMMMKKILFSSLFLLSSLISQAQHEYTIEGEVKGVKDGTHVSLFLTDGRVGSIVGTDTIRNGTFFFKRNAGESGMDHLSLMCRDTDFPPMSLDIYATPGAKIKITGHLEVCITLQCPVFYLLNIQRVKSNSVHIFCRK